MHNAKITIGLAGFGTVGSGVYSALNDNRKLIAMRSGVEFSVKKIAVRDLAKPRGLPAELFTGDYRELIADEQIDIIVELIGGVDEAYQLVKSALQAKKAVVTGNKALLAEHADELFALARKNKTAIFFEAAVAGGIPIINALHNSFAANHILSIVGIINGTSNFILEQMTAKGQTYQQALEQASILGYAEADPSLDVNGWDAAHKALLLALMAYGFTIPSGNIHVSGIEEVTPVDIQFADKLGYSIKLLAVIRQLPEGIELRVQPSFISQNHLLSKVNGVYNALALRGDQAGESLLYGLGAGKQPTASSVVADLIEAARQIHGGELRGFTPWQKAGTLIDIKQTQTPYYVRFRVTDKPGVIAAIAGELAAYGIGISGTSSLVDPDKPDREFVDMVFLLHSTKFGVLQQALQTIAKLDCVTAQPVVFRIENLNN